MPSAILRSFPIFCRCFAVTRLFCVETTPLRYCCLEGCTTKVSRIAYGIPVGMDIEYADEVTLLKSIEGRRDL